MATQTKSAAGEDTKKVGSTFVRRRDLGFSQERPASLPMDPAQRLAPSIQDRFRTMIREREHELREVGEGGLEMSLLDEQDIVQIYEELLADLIFNSKPTITDLTIIAGEMREPYSKCIADAICNRIDEVPRDQKLPALYLLDSIVKNIGREYVKFFAARLPKVFCEAYKEVPSNLHPAMRHLFGTWSRVFPAAALGKIEEELKFSSPENLRSSSLSTMRDSESPRPSHGIHINPKYLEARQNSTTGVKHPREVSFRTQASGEIPSIKISERDSDHVDLQPSYLKMVREGSPQSATPHGSAMAGGQERPFLSSQGKVIRTLSPKRLPRSSVRANEVASPPRSGFEFGPQRVSERDGWCGRSWTTDDGVHQAAALTTSEYGRQRQRELIDAYGNYRGKDTVHERLPKIQRVDVNGIKGETMKMDWQNSEEEEYVWDNVNQIMSDEMKRNSNGNLGIMSQKSDLIRKPTWLLPPVRDIDDRITHRDDYGLRSTNKMLYLVDDAGRLPSSHAFHRLSQGSLSPKSVEKPSQPPYLHNRNSFFDNPRSREAPLLKLSTAYPEAPNKAQNSSVAPVLWPSAYKSQHLPSPHTHLNYIDANKQIGNQQPNLYRSAPQQQTNTNDKNLFSKGLVPPYQLSGGSIGPPVLAPAPASSVGAQPHDHTAMRSMPDFSMHCRGALPPLPPGQPPPQPTSKNTSGTSHSPVIAFSGLISSLMAQGLISLAPQAQLENSVGLEFNSELLKIRHESAINVMYAELPRQCTTCGLRFHCQEDHSNHMDWHVTKNRMSRNRKQKPSRNWFVSAKEWLCGAETLGTDVVPGFLASESVAESKEDQELAVPADENQTVCALCGEPFEDFYSDENEEWMYKGAVYLNAPNGNIEGLDRSRLGPIVHAKCRPESTEGSSA